ncbi:hemolysin family protein [Acidovorax sp. A1169]|jgi:putative hemolysin|uniref:hemolysin family protein n=1 Tax=Acidovorax sp. A1169 TaxID=3059524 RepID=UPI002737DABB|nr:hemolysin family protein [Acidovorax sp. A1169]MDP4073975.1 hemolysin family protein [Acidovorax sp. A1169]
MDFLLIALLTLLNGVFAMSELALASSRKSRLVAMAEGGDKGAQASLTLLENPTQFLSSVQVGITSIGMLNGIIGEAAFSDDLARWLLALGMPERASGITATALVVTVITFITIVFGELVPKRIGQLYPETVARLVARPMTWVALVAKPFVRLLSLSTQGVLGLLRIDNNAGRAVTEEEIVASLEEGRDAGVIEHHEHQMVRNVFRLDDRPLTSLMVPRTDMQWLDARLTVAEGLRMAGTGGDHGAHSWYPVCRGSLDEVVGLISVARLLELGVEAPGAIEQYALPAAFLPETLSGMELLEQFRARSGRMVFVVDEYGVVQGIMTPRDLLEAITGELQPGAATDAWASQREDGLWLLDGLMPVSELKARLDIRDLPGEERGRYNTLAGLLMAESGRLPAVGERIACAGWIFEVLGLEGRRIDRVLAQMDPADGSG